MNLMTLENISKSYSEKILLKDISLGINEGEKIGIIGVNGTGKSTLLKIIAGQLSYDSGEIIMPKGIKLGYLDQHAGLESDLSIWDEMMTVFEPLKQLEQQIRSLELQMAEPMIYENAERYQKITAEYDQLQHDFKERGGFQYEADTRSVLHGMQFYPDSYEQSISSLSGGQRTRLALAKLLLTKPELLILDEPTNHLDIETLNWLENYLKNYDGAILIVSHDRYFLDQVVSIVYEVSRHHVTKFTGNYSSYLDQKAKNYERDLKLYEKQMDEKAKLETFVQKNLARASTTKMAQSRRKVLEKTEWMDSPDGDEKSATFTFDIEKQSGNDVLSVDDLTIGYGQTPISEHINMRAYRKDRIALVGPNGVGKSTLLKTIIKDLPALSGDIRYGTNVQLGYYDQDLAKLSTNRTVLREIWDEWPLMNEKDVRTVLGRFLFSGEDVDKIVHDLSGGEKARLTLAKLMLEKNNVLILDEPTNHLDLDSKEVLENALIDFPGTLIFVSHDRYFINRIATKVVELSNEGSFEYLGDYDYYVEKKEELAEIAAEKEAALIKTKPIIQKEVPTSNQAIDKETKKKERKIQRQIEDIEQIMSDLETTIAKLEEELCDPDVFSNHEKALIIQTQLDEEKVKHEEYELQWLALQEELEQL